MAGFLDYDQIWSDGAGMISLNNVVFTNNSAINGNGADIAIHEKRDFSWIGGSSTHTGMSGTFEQTSTAFADYHAFNGGSVYVFSSRIYYADSECMRLTETLICLDEFDNPKTAEVIIDSVWFSGGRVSSSGGVVYASGIDTTVVMKNIYINDTAGLRNGAISAVKKIVKSVDIL